MIYFIQQGNDGPIKIGYTGKEDIDQRLRHCKPDHPKNSKFWRALTGICDLKKNSIICLKSICYEVNGFIRMKILRRLSGI